MRAGAGYVTAFVPASLNLIFESRLLEVMTVPLPDSEASLEPDGAEAVLERADRVRRARAGPGDRARRPERSSSCGTWRVRRRARCCSTPTG